MGSSPSMAFDGFPRRVRFVPVPGPVFGPLLEQIDDLGELKCTLRVIWMLHHKRGYPRFVTLKEVMSDRVLATALATEGYPDRQRVERGMTMAVERGTLVTGNVARDGGEEPVYMLNTEADRRTLAGMTAEGVSPEALPKAEPWEGATERANIFALYEDNIGMLSPMIAEELREAEELYPMLWIDEAFRESISQNKRSWRYIARILERWEREGRTDGESRRHPKKAGYY